MGKKKGKAEYTILPLLFQIIVVSNVFALKTGPLKEPVIDFLKKMILSRDISVGHASMSCPNGNKTEAVGIFAEFASEVN